MRKGIGLGLGKGYKNILPYDSYVHSLSAKGVSLNLKGSCVSCEKPYKLSGKNRETRDFYCKECDEDKAFELHTGCEWSDPEKEVIWYECPKCHHVIDEGDLANMEEDARIDAQIEEDAIRRHEQELEKKGHKVDAKGDFGLAKIQLVKPTKLPIKLPTVQVLTAKQFDTKFKDDYEEWEQGYATTKISPDGTTKIYVRDDGNTDYTKEGKLLMHELKELEIFDNLVNKKGVNPNIADEMAHNLNPVKVEGVSNTYPIDPNN